MGAQVIATNVASGGGDGLDATGQAQRIATATSGTFFPSGSDVVLDEAVTVAPDAPQGSTLGCTTTFRINGADAGPEFVQTVSVKVNDVTPPTVSCGPGVNPDGHTPGGGRNAGFLRMVAVDNLPGVTVGITDDTTGTTSRPYASGTDPPRQPGTNPGGVALVWT
ncbi:MAG: hypothetical protein HOQ27_13470 [Dermatophilaceae bacterium]|nr:hypothetical protein [Dermatophilaceae bacterium]